MCSLRKGGALANMMVPSRQSSLWNNKARLARSRSDSKKRHRCCLTRIGRQNKAIAYLNCCMGVKERILLRFNMRLVPLLIRGQGR
jgi:hypothetical protein